MRRKLFIGILLIFGMLVMSCNQYTPDTITVKTDSPLVKVYYSGSYVYVTGEYDGIITHVNFTVNQRQQSLNQTIVKDQTVKLYDLTYYLTNNMYDDITITITDVITN